MGEAQCFMKDRHDSSILKQHLDQTIQVMLRLPPVTCMGVDQLPERLAMIVVLQVCKFVDRARDAAVVPTKRTMECVEAATGGEVTRLDMIGAMAGPKSHLEEKVCEEEDRQRAELE